MCCQVVRRFLDNPDYAAVGDLDDHKGPLDVSPAMRRLCSEWIVTPADPPRIFAVVDKQCLPLLQLFLDLPEGRAAVIGGRVSGWRLRVTPEGAALQDGWLEGFQALWALLRCEDVRCDTTAIAYLIKIALQRLKRHHIPLLNFLFKIKEFDGRLEDGTTVLQHMIKTKAKPKHVHWMLLECGQDPVHVGGDGPSPLEMALATGGYWQLLCNVPGIYKHLDLALEHVLTGEQLPKAAIHDFMESSLFTYVVATTLRLYTAPCFDTSLGPTLYGNFKAVLCHDAMTEVRLDYVNTEYGKLGPCVYPVARALRLGRKAFADRVEQTKASYPPVSEPRYTPAPPPAPMTWIPGRTVGVPKRARDY